MKLQKSVEDRDETEQEPECERTHFCVITLVVEENNLIIAADVL